MTSTTCLHHLVEAQVLETPDHNAVAFDGSRLTYAELDQRASVLAAHLQSIGAATDARVGLFLNHSVETVVGMLAVLKAGAAYVPIDPAYSAERVAFLIADSGAKILLTETSLVAKVAGQPGVICLDTFDWSQEAPAVEANVTPDHLAYVIYPGNRSGQPRGVAIEHRNIVSYVRAIAERLRLESGMQHATAWSFAADLANVVLFPALTTGGCLHVLAEDLLQNQSRLAEYFQRERIDVFKIMPSHFAALQGEANPERVMPRRRLILGGEASRVGWIERLRALAPGCEIFNHYGHTETTVGAVTFHVGDVVPSTRYGTLPLGRALSHSRVYVLGPDAAPVPDGIEGDLFIGGEGVGRGYLNRPDLTAGKFLADPFREGGRMYRTGERARVLPTGDVELLDRVDADPLTYWKRALSDAPLVLDLPCDRPRRATHSIQIGTERFTLSRPLIESIKRLAAEEQASLFVTLHAGFMALLHRYTGQSDILAGTPVPGNTLVLRAQFQEGQDFRGLVRRLRDAAQAAFAHAGLAFKTLVSELARDRDASCAPIVQVMFGLQDAAGHPRREPENSPLDLSLMASETAQGLDAVFEYRTDLFEASTVRRMSEHFRMLLEGLVAAPEQAVTRVPLLTEAEQASLRAWNATDAPVSPFCVHELVLAQCARTPNRIAVTSAGRTLTYGELAQRVEKLAGRLRKAGVRPGTRVGVFLDRSLDMVVGVLAAMRAGASYVPLDPAFPRERLSHMVADSKPTVLLAHERTLGEVPSTSVPIIMVDQLGHGAPTEPVITSSTPDDLAYVIYTSGSTGQPKGVAITHRALVNLLESMGRTPGLRETDVWLAVTTLSFDIAALELYLPLMTGASIALATRDEAKDAHALMALMESSGATVLQATPATWRMLIESGWTGRSSMKVLCGGEALTRDLADSLIVRTAEVWNVYGPTETTVWSTVSRVTAGDAAISIGRPIANTQCWVLDAHGAPLPFGVPGELCIGGMGVAHGYWERPALTSERFIADTLAGTPGARLYRTGDLARWRADGTLECLGRTDHQIKLRGFRIELGEIDSCLTSHPGVRQSVTIVREDRPGEKKLVSYVVLNGALDGELGDVLRTHARKTLPDYMVPSFCVAMQRLPLTPNGKIDRTALPAPDAPVTSNAAPPSTPMESLVLDLFRDVMGRQDLWVHDNFFEYGGDSLMAAKLMTNLRAASRLDLALRNLFDRPTASGLAVVLEQLAWVAHASQPVATSEGREEMVL